MNKFLMIAIAIGMSVIVSAQEVSVPKYGADSVVCANNLSIYSNAFLQWEKANFAPESISMEMVKAWREILLNCPHSSQLIYTKGEKIMDYFIRTNPAQKDAYIDTICMMMDNRAKYFPTDPKTGASQVANILGRKGFLIYTYNKNRYEEAYIVLKDAVALDASQLQGAYINAYFKATIDMVNKGKAEKTTITEIYLEIMDLLDGNIQMLAEKKTQLLETKTTGEANNSDATAKIEMIEKATKTNKSLMDEINGLFRPYASCEELTKFLSVKMDKTPDDVNLLKHIIFILEKNNCTYSNLFNNAYTRLQSLEPNSESVTQLDQKPQDKRGTIKEGSVYIGNVISPKQIASYGTPAWLFSTMSIIFTDGQCVMSTNKCAYSINLYTGGLDNVVFSQNTEAISTSYLVKNGNVYIWDSTEGKPKDDAGYIFIFKINDDFLTLIKTSIEGIDLSKYIYMSDYNKMKKMNEEQLQQIEKVALNKLLGR